MNRSLRSLTRANSQVLLFLAALLLCLRVPAGAQPDPLPSWNEGRTKQSILRFVREVTVRESPRYVPPAERIATFDNDGTLWVEQPIYTEFVYSFARVRALAPQHPEWRTTPPFQAVLENNLAQLEGSTEAQLFQLITATHAGVTTTEFTRLVSEWLATARHPRFQRPYTELSYQPMLELLALLRARGFKTFIVSGGGIDFMRPWTERVYGIPPEQVVGTTLKTEFQLRDGQPVLLRLPQTDDYTNFGGKPVGIERAIGRWPVAAFGNSDGDQQMLEYTAGGSGARFMALVHHTDAVREYAYDRKSWVGQLDKALDEAQRRGWTVIDMKRDWRVIFPWEKEGGK